MADKLTVGRVVFGPTLAEKPAVAAHILGDQIMRDAEAARVEQDKFRGRIAALEAENARLQAQVMAMPIIVRSIADFPDDPTRPDKAMTGMRISYGALRKFKALAKSTGSPDGQQ